MNALQFRLCMYCNWSKSYALLFVKGVVWYMLHFEKLMCKKYWFNHDNVIMDDFFLMFSLFLGSHTLAQSGQSQETPAATKTTNAAFSVTAARTTRRKATQIKTLPSLSTFIQAVICFIETKPAIRNLVLCIFYVLFFVFDVVARYCKLRSAYRERESLWYMIYYSYCNIKIWPSLSDPSVVHL